MKKKILIGLLSVALLLSVIPVMAKADGDGTFVGQQMSIGLEACPSSGYAWELTYDPAYFSLIKEECIPISPANCMYTWTFEALQTGDSIIIFKYKRPWETYPVYKVVHRIRIKDL